MLYLLITASFTVCALFFFLAFNICRNRKTEKLLSVCDQKIKSFINHAADIVLLFDKTGGIVESNQQACNILGYLPEELSKLHITDIDKELAEVPHLKDFILKLQHEQSVTTETYYRRKNNKSLPVEVHFGLLQSNGERLILGLARDITERKQSEKALRENEKLLREAQQIAHLGHWRLDLLSNNLFWSDEIYQIFEVEKKYFKESYEAFLNMVHPDDRDIVNKAFVESIKNRVSYDIIHRLLLPNGQIKFVHERCRHKYNDEGQVISSIGTVHDITHVKKAELEMKKIEKQLRQVQKLEAIGTLAGGIAHDFNNIISSVLGYTQLCMDQVDKNSLTHENLSYIFDAGCRAKDLVGQILTFSRQTEHETVPTVIKPIIKEAVKLLRATIPATIEIKAHIASEARIMADATQIHQVVMNLCTNAAQAMADMGGILSIELKEVYITEEFAKQHIELNEGDYLNLIISDTGHGMSSEIMERIFEPFFTTKSAKEGTGLGLSVVHGIVNSYGGQISTYSEPGAGTTFSIYFPITEASIDLKQESSGPPPRGDEKIFVIDDEPAIVKMLQRMLISLGYSVEASTNPAHALKTLETEPVEFDLVITDLTMPAMTGDQLAEKILEKHKSMPIIVCSGFSDRIVEDSILSKGVRAFVRKPLLKSEIARIIRDVLEQPL